MSNAFPPSKNDPSQPGYSSQNYPPHDPTLPNFPAGLYPIEPPSGPIGLPPRPGRGNRLLWFGIGCGGLLLLLCGGIGAAIFVGYRPMIVEKPRIDETLETFFLDMAHKDYNTAYKYLSTTAHAQQPRQQYDALAAGPFGQTLQGFESCQTTGFKVFLNKPVTAGAPATTSARVSGTLRYLNGRTGSFDALLEKQGRSWRIYAINVNASPLVK